MFYGNDLDRCSRSEVFFKIGALDSHLREEEAETNTFGLYVIRLAKVWQNLARIIRKIPSIIWWVGCYF